jgi:hypothetical protein
MALGTLSHFGHLSNLRHDSSSTRGYPVTALGHVAAGAA